MSEPKTRKIRKYDDEFKANILSIYKKDERNIKQLAKDYGIPESTLWGWIEKEENRVSKNKGEYPEVKELKKELANVKEDRDILKKALAIFSMPPKN
jgi:transposase